MSNKLQLQVILSALDKATAPLKRMRGSSIGAAQALKDTRAKLKELNAAQNDVSAWRTQRTAAVQTEQALSAARERVKLLGREMAATGVPTKAMTRDFQAAVREASKLKQQHQQQQVALQGLRNKLGAAGISTRNLSDGERELRNRINATTQALGEQETRLKRTTEQQKRLAAARDRYQKTTGLAGSMAGTGAAGMATGGAVLYAGSQMMAPQLAAQQQAARIAAQSGTDASAYSGIIQNLRTDGLSQDITAIGDALGAVNSTLRTFGQVGNDTLERITRKAMDVSTVMGGDVSEHIQTVAILMQNGLASSADHALDLISAGMQQVSSKMRDEMPEILHEYSTHFRGLGYTGAEAMSLLVEMSKQGKFALDKTGDAIKEFSIRGSDMSKASVEAYELVGLNAELMSNAIAGGGTDARKALQETAKALLAMNDPAARANAAIALFGTPIEDLAVDQIPAFLAALGQSNQRFKDVAGTADELGKTLRDNLGGDIARLSGSWSGLNSALMESQDGPLRDLVQSLTGVVQSITAWAKENPALAAGVVKLAMGFGLLVAAGGSIMVVLGSVLGPLAMVRYAMTLMAVATTAASWPILAIVAAVALLAAGAYLLYKNWGSVSAFFGGLWAEIRAGFSGGIAGIAATIINFSPMGLFYRAFAGVMSYFGIELPATFTGFGGMLINGMINGISAGLGKLKDSITGMGGKAIGWFKEKLGIHSPSRVFAGLGGDTMAGLTQGLAAGSKDALKQVAGTAKNLVDQGSSVLTGGINFDTRAPIRAQSAAGGMVVQGDTVQITIQAAPGTDVNGMRQMLNQLLDERERSKAARLRARLQDTE